MSYEVVYSFYEKIGDEYDTKEVKDMTKRYGKKTEDIPVEKVASLILRELSRRDIWVTNVKVFQFVKKEINFKEVKGGGIVLGHKKFNLDLSHEDLSSEIESNELPLPVKNFQQSTQNPKPQYTREPILKQVLYNPPKEFLKEARKYKLTSGRKYPVFEEKLSGTFSAGGQATTQGALIYYRTKDDTGSMVMANSFLFEDVVQLQYQNEMRDIPNNGPDLMNSPEFMEDNFSLRK